MGRVRGTGHTLRVPVRCRRVTTHNHLDRYTPTVERGALPPLGRDTTANGFHILTDGVVNDAATKPSRRRSRDGSHHQRPHRRIDTTS